MKYIYFIALLLNFSVCQSQSFNNPKFNSPVQIGNNNTQNIYIDHTCPIHVEIVEKPKNNKQKLCNGLEVPAQYSLNKDGTLTIPAIKGLSVLVPFIVDNTVIQDEKYDQASGTFDNSKHGGFVIGNHISFNAILTANDDYTAPYNQHSKNQPRKYSRYNKKEAIVNADSILEASWKETNLLRFLLGDPIKITRLEIKKIGECIEKGADVNCLGVQADCVRQAGWTALHVAAYFDDSELAIKVMSRPNANLNIHDSIRCATPLWYASKKNSLKVAKLLLNGEYGRAKVNAFSKTGSFKTDWHYETPLDVADSKEMKGLLSMFGALKFEQLSSSDFLSK